MAAAYTTTLTYPDFITIQATDNVLELSIFVLSGSVNLLGGGAFQGNNSTTASIPTGASQTFVNSAASPLEGLKITPAASGASASIVITR